MIVPVRDGRRYLAEALESVLAQTRPAAELIVVDDGSTDDGAALAREVAPAATVVSRPRLGEAAARNHGVELATGSHLAFLDADDRWRTDKLELQAEVFARDPKVELVFGQVLEFLSEELDGTRFVRQGQEVDAAHPGLMLVGRGAFERVGPFDETWTIGVFLDWLMRARELGLRERTVPRVLYERRLHHRSTGTLSQERRSDYAHIIKRRLDRGRKM